MAPDSDLGVSIAAFTVRLPEAELATTVTASVQGKQVSAEVRAAPDAGAALRIKINDIDYRNQRYRMQNNVVKIAARHPSLRRYLGASPDFPGQNDERFRVLVAEIVADAICAAIVSRNADMNLESYAGADWDWFYAEYSEYMTKFLPIAHKIVVPD